jgi:hypothetical protein
VKDLDNRRKAMSRIVVVNHVTLDGVMQAPGRPDEDRDAVDAAANLDERPGDDLVVLGSGVLVHALMWRNLVDAAFRLVDFLPTTTGVIIARYQPAEPPAG